MFERHTHRTFFVFLALLTVTAFVHRAPAQTLSIGDPAPALQVVKWESGGPVNLAAARGTRMHVIEFWAPHCAQSVDRLFNLNDLQAKYRDKLTVVSIAEGSPEAVKDRLAEKKLEVNFALTCDDYQGNAEVYMAAVGAQGIPYTFVVDRDGLIAWHGPPGHGVGKVLEAMFAGTYTVETGREILTHEASLGGALMAEQWKAALLLIDRLIQMDPNPLRYQMLKFNVLSDGKKDAEAAKAFAPVLLTALPHYLDLDDFARGLLSGDLGEDYYDLALTFCKAAYEASGGDKKDIAHSYARAMFLNGDIQGAVRLEKRALELAGGDDVFLRMTLNKYEKAAKKP
ncbi:MAG TPA: TlpA disulfide reductase family protein [Phycisphaerae bacterium]|nr:TlpA disulfide reductase family protein [Phycisphaerae bacterium]